MAVFGDFLRIRRVYDCSLFSSVRLNESRDFMEFFFRNRYAENNHCDKHSSCSLSDMEQFWAIALLRNTSFLKQSSFNYSSLFGDSLGSINIPL